MASEGWKNKLEALTLETRAHILRRALKHSCLLPTRAAPQPQWDSIVSGEIWVLELLGEPQKSFCAGGYTGDLMTQGVDGRGARNTQFRSTLMILVVAKLY